MSKSVQMNMFRRSSYSYLLDIDYGLTIALNVDVEPVFGPNCA